MRAFIAIPVPEVTADALLNLQRHLGFGKSLPRENLHLTLAFLDDQTEERLEALHEELLDLRHRPFTVTLSGVGVFGAAIHAPALENTQLTDLHAQISSACRRAGIPLQRRRFRPHITLARLGKGQTPPPLRAALSEFHIPQMEVGQFALCRSSLHPKGARHYVLASYLL